MLARWEREVHWDFIKSTRGSCSKSVFAIILETFSGIRKTAIIYRQGGIIKC